MLSERNQDYYHDKCISLIPSFAKNVLVIGGGDNAIASRLAIRKEVSSIEVVEIDVDIVNISKKYFPKTTLSAEMISVAKLFFGFSN